MTQYQIGDKVRLKKNLEKVGKISNYDDFLDGQQMYEVSFGEKVDYIAESALMPFTEQNTVLQNFLENNFSNYHDFQKAYTFLKLNRSSSIQNNVYAFNTSKTIFYEYQYKPLIKFINSQRRRILICDEVGLGKTVEAGLIMKELDARNELEKVLIVVPANLRIKWKTEMANRFGEDFYLLNAKEFAGLLIQDRTTINKYKKHRFIISAESIRSQYLSELLDDSELEWDLLIVDEAHSMRNRNKQHNAVKALGDNSKSMVFLTATPVHIAEENLFNILNIMDELQYDNLNSFEKQLKDNAPVVYALNAISQAKPNLSVVRELVESVKGQFSENPIYQDLCAILQEGSENGLSTDMIVEIQRNLSELHFIGPIYNRTLKKDVLKDRHIRVPHNVKVDFTAEEYRTYNELIEGIEKRNVNEPFAVCSAKQKLSSSLNAHRSSIEIDYETQVQSFEEFDLFEESNEESKHQAVPLPNWKLHDSKFEKLMQIMQTIQNHTKKVIIFAFFKETLRYLSYKLQTQKIKCYMLHGDVKFDERQSLIGSFKDAEDFCVLLSSRVGSEGIDLQFCDTIINYDLPWNPMELEQRIGRIDRIGQKSQKIHIYNFGMVGTVDDMILSRLYERIAIFESTIGVLEPILGDLRNIMLKQMFYTKLSPEEMEIRLAEEDFIIKRKLKNLKDMEKASSELLSLDLYFNKEIESIQRNRRYINPMQLFQYLAGHIAKNYKGSEISYDSVQQKGYLFVCKDFGRALKEIMPNEPELDVFGYGRRIEFTFSSEKALENEKLQFINVLHPIIKAITKYYADLNLMHNCHYFRLTKKTLKDNQIDLEPGYYFYSICVGSIEDHSNRKTSIIMPVILNEELEPVGTNDFCEQIIGIAVEEATPSVSSLTIEDKEYLIRAHDIAFDIFKKRFEEYFKRFRARHELTIEHRLKSELYYWTNRMNKAQKRLDDLKGQEETQRNIIHMFTKQLENDNKKMLAKMEVLLEQKKCSPSYGKPEYGGVFEVI